MAKFLTFVLIGIAFLILIGFCVPDPTPEQLAQRAAQEAAQKEKEEQERLAKEKAEREKQEQEERACRKDLACWAERHISDAMSVCRLLIQDSAKFDYEWDSWMNPDFSKYAWKKKPKGIVSYFGNDVKFQNMFGAWQRMSYWCSYDPETKKAEIIFHQR